MRRALSAVAIASAMVLPTAVIPAKAQAQAQAKAPNGAAHDRAVAQAQAMIAAAPVVPGSTSVDVAPDKDLDGPATYPEIDGLVKLGAWWTVDENVTKAFAELTGTTPDGYNLTGSGGFGRIHKPPSLVFKVYAPVTVPDGINQEELLIEASRLSKTETGIAVYANVVGQRKRPTKEIVPDTGASVTLTKTAHYGGKHPIVRKLHGALAAKVVRDFNQLVVEPNGSSSCPADPKVYTATFVADGHTWVASTGCLGIGVVRDGQRLPSLQDDQAFDRDLTRLTRHQPK